MTQDLSNSRNGSLTAVFTSVRYVLLCALRDRLFIGLMLAVVGASLVSASLGGTAFLEEREMTLAYAAGSARLILIVGLIVFCCFHLRSAFDTREIDVMLSRPISRPMLAFAYWLGFTAVATLLVLPTAFIIALIGPMSQAGFLAWTASLLLETWLMVALALFAALALRSAVSAVMTCLGFYVLARMMAFFVMAADSLGGGTVWYLTLSKQALHTISSIMPRLDFFGKSEWVIYGMTSQSEWRLFATQFVIYLPVLLLAAIVDFRRKQF